MDEKKIGDTSELISMRGDRLIWLDFTNKIRKDRKKVWEVLQPMIDDYMEENNK